MNSFFKLESSNYLNYGIKKAPKLGEQSVMLGQVVDQSKLPPLIYEHNFPVDEPIPHYLTGGAVLASKVFLEVLDSIGIDNYQAFPAVLLNPETGDKREDYFLFNVIGFIPAANIGSHVTSGLAIFRLEDEPVSIVVSNQVVEALKSNKPKEGWGIFIENMDMPNP